MGRRRRRVVKIVKRKLPKVFDCPKCGETSIRINISKETRMATVQCGSCGLKQELEISPSLEEIDAYCMFIDAMNKTLVTNI